MLSIINSTSINSRYTLIYSLLYVLMLLPLYMSTYIIAQIPELTIVLIVDQFAYHELLHARANLTGGIKFLCDNGIFCTAASAGNGFPETAPGHTGIATGSFAKDHGIVANSWHDKSTNQIVQCDDDANPAYRVLSLTGHQDYSKSSHNLKVDTLSDQFVINSPVASSYEVYSISLKSRASILTSGRLGKPIWLDPVQAIFTSSKAYFKTLPDWLINWNKSHAQALKTISLDAISTLASGATDILTLDLALTCLSQSIQQLNLSLSSTNTGHTNNKKNKVLWISLSGLDYIGHALGPKNTITRNYLVELDKTLAYFMSAINSLVDPQKTLWILTADHGVMPIPEELPHSFTLAQRVDAKKFIENCNGYLKNNYGITDLVKTCDGFSLYLNEKKLSSYSQETQNKLLQALKNYIRTQPGIRQVWTFEELVNTPLPAHDIRTLIKNQLYKDRSGHLIYLVHPYTLITYNVTDGTAHQTPYDYDTHIPLIIYQRNFLEHQIISTPVYAQQIAPTIAQIHGIPKPSASTLPVLPIAINKDLVKF